MASASVSSGAAVSALLQKASQQYLECRRKVSAKFDEVKTLEKEIASLFETISTLGENATSRTAKSVGRLELNIVAIEGDAPVDDAVISVDIDPEYEEPEEAEEEEKPEQSEGDKDEEAKEEAAEQEKTESENAEEAPVEEATEKAVPRRSIAWVDVDSLPLSVVYDPVQSREAVVIIAISPSAEDGEETEPVKEFRIPVSSLFQTGHINRWYVIKKVEHVHVDKTALTEVADEDEPTPAADEPAKEEEAEKPAEEAEKPAEEAEKRAEDEATTTEEAEKPAEESEKPAEESEKPVEGESEKEASAEDSEKKAASDEPAVEIPTAPHQTLVAAEATTESEDTVVVLKEGKIHVQVHFTMSEIEKLSQTAIALAQQKQEAEAALEVLEREALSLRTKYERLNASQRSLSAGGVVKPRSTLLGGRGLGAVPARVEKSAYQKLKDSVSAVLTPQRTQVLTSFAIFFGSAALFHYQGDNLLA